MQYSNSYSLVVRFMNKKPSGKRRDKFTKFFDTIKDLLESFYSVIQVIRIASSRMAAVTMTMKETKQIAAATADDGVETLQKIGGADVISAECECCGLTEEYTLAYISRIRERYQGRWICGLCGEAVKYEIVRSEKRIGSKEALDQHMSFCKKFKALKPPPNRTEELIPALKQLWLRSLDSPGRSSPMRKELVRSRSCVPTLDT